MLTKNQNDVIKVRKFESSIILRYLKEEKRIELGSQLKKSKMEVLIRK